MRWGNDEVTAYTSDISMSGVFVETNRCLPVGTMVSLDFQLVSGEDTLPVSVRGRVARRVFAQRKDDPKHLVGIGVEFRKFRVGEGLLRRVLATLGGTAPKKDDKRNGSRIPVSIPISWGTDDDCRQPGHFTDISVDGAFVIHSTIVQRPGTRLYIRFEVPHQGRFREVKAVATVVRTVNDGDAPAGMAVIFELSTVDVDYLQAFITRRLPAGQAAGAAMTEESRGLLRQSLGRLASRAKTSNKRPRPGQPGGHEIRLRWIIKALCYTLPVMLLAALLILC